MPLCPIVSLKNWKKLSLEEKHAQEQRINTNNDNK